MKEISKDDLIMHSSMELPYEGGSIYFSSLDALNIYTDIAKSKFLEDINIVKRPSTSKLLAVHLKETLFNKDLAQFIITQLVQLNNPVRKLVFVGLDSKGKRLMSNTINECNLIVLYIFCNDYEKAKEWLIR